MKVMLVDDNPRRAARVEASLRACGVDTLCQVPGPAGLLRQIEQQTPDVIVIDLDSPGRDILESLSIISAHNPTPVVMFSGEEDPDYIAEAIDAGVTVYLVDGIKADTVKPIIDAAMAQFRRFERLRGELDTTLTELGERKLVDQAKALMMKHYGSSEQECYACIRSESMNRSMKTVEVAQRIIDALSTRTAPNPGGQG